MTTAREHGVEHCLRLVVGCPDRFICRCDIVGLRRVRFRAMGTTLLLAFVCLFS
jgi:hypothetical protein